MVLNFCFFSIPEEFFVKISIYHGESLNKNKCIILSEHGRAIQVKILIDFAMPRNIETAIWYFFHLTHRKIISGTIIRKDPVVWKRVSLITYTVIHDGSNPDNIATTFFIDIHKCHVRIIFDASAIFLRTLLFSSHGVRSTKLRT